MVFFLIIILIVSILGLVSLLALKNLELSTGKVVFATARPKVNGFFQSVLLFIELGLPFLVRVGTRRLLQIVKAFVQKALARVILWIESLLQKMLHAVDQTTEPPHVRGEASAFLREVGEYKKKLERRMSRSKVQE